MKLLIRRSPAITFSAVDGSGRLDGATEILRALRSANHKGPDASFDRAVAKAARQRRSRLCRRMFEAGSIARLDFIAQRRTFAETDGRIARRRRFAFLVHRVDRYLRKARGAQLPPDLLYIVVAVRGARQKARRIRRERAPPGLAR